MHKDLRNFLKVESSLAKDTYDLIEHLELDIDYFGKLSLKMVPIVFLGMQNLNDNLHFALERTNNFFFLFM